MLLPHVPTEKAGMEGRDENCGQHRKRKER